MPVFGYKNVYESLDFTIKEEVIDEYETPNFGNRKANKGLKYKSIPPVLLFQLKRFDWVNNRAIKVMD